MEYLLHLLILITIYIMLAQSLSLIAGFAGMISLAHAGFFGIGAYTTAILSVNYHFPFLITLPVGMVICGIIAILISTIAIRTVDDYFIICTIGIQIVIFSIMNNWMSLTNGPLGISGIQPINIFGLNLSNKLPFLLLSIIFTLAIYMFLRFIIKSGFGRVLKAISEDEIYTQSIGKNVYLSKVTAFAISAMIAAIPGVLYAHYISYIDPTSFTVDESIFILSIVIIGGMRNLMGILIAAAFLVLLPEALRFIGLPNLIAANLRQIIYGIILIVVIFKSDTIGFTIVTKE
ncbi:MAG: branched-chain amino acid ABC transporter permease [Bacteroidetes bacterium]|nr:branched-chain amino acid ABC transporter permease [Bacteroidota bacterium]